MTFLPDHFIVSIDNISEDFVAVFINNRRFRMIVFERGCGGRFDLDGPIYLKKGVYHLFEIKVTNI